MALWPMEKSSVGFFGFPGLCKRQVKHKWSSEEDAKLTLLVNQMGEANWKRIASNMGTRNCRQCRERWKNYLSPNVCRDPWTREEDDLLMDKYREFGSQWSLIAKSFPKRTDVNLKNRWVVLTSHADPEKRVRRYRRNEEQPSCPLEAWSNMDHFLEELSLFNDDDENGLALDQFSEICSF